MHLPPRLGNKALPIWLTPSLQHAGHDTYLSIPTSPRSHNNLECKLQCKMYTSTIYLFIPEQYIESICMFLNFV